MSGSGYAYDTTNNKMELKAIIEGLAAVRLLIENDDFNSIYVFSDSAYCVNCVEQKWYAKWQKNGWCNSKKEPVKNKELWKQLIPYFENPQFFFKKVKGHSGIEENEYVDKLAREAIITLREGGLD